MSIKKRIISFKFALQGIKTLFATQPNARIHAVAMVVVMFVGFCFDIKKSEWCIIVLAITSVISAEALNTAIENVVDLVSPDYHPLAGKAKDVAAAAVLITAIGAATVGMIIFLPYIFR